MRRHDKECHWRTDATTLTLSCCGEAHQIVLTAKGPLKLLNHNPSVVKQNLTEMSIASNTDRLTPCERFLFVWKNAGKLMPTCMLPNFDTIYRGLLRVFIAHGFVHNSSTPPENILTLFVARSAWQGSAEEATKLIAAVKNRTYDLSKNIGAPRKCRPFLRICVPAFTWGRYHMLKCLRGWLWSVTAWAVHTTDPSRLYTHKRKDEAIRTCLIYFGDQLRAGRVLTGKTKKLHQKLHRYNEWS